MKKRIISLSTIAFACLIATTVFISSCKKEKVVVQHNTETTEEVNRIETTFDPGSVAKAKLLIEEFIAKTKDPRSKTTNGDPDVTVDEGVWFLEGGANYLQNVNLDQEFIEIHEHTISVLLTNAGEIDGQHF